MVSNLQGKKKVRPYVRWNKETDEWTCHAYYDDIDPDIVDEQDEELNMDEGRKKILHAISNLVVALRNKDQTIPTIEDNLESVDEWLTEQYALLEVSKDIEGNHFIDTHIDQCFQEKEEAIFCAQGS